MDKNPNPISITIPLAVQTLDSMQHSAPLIISTVQASLALLVMMEESCRFQGAQEVVVGC